MPSVILPYQWSPREYQLPLWTYLEEGGTRAVACWHRRSGKDDVALRWASVAAMRRVATYWHLLPEAAQARKAIWEAINPHTGKRRIDEAFPLELRSTTREQEMMIKFINGSTWQVVGSDNYNSLVGSPPAGVVFSEWSLANPLSWGYIRPILVENGGWALFIYTPRGRNHGYTTYESAKHSNEWFSQTLTAEQTGVFTRAQLDKELIEYQNENGPSIGKALFRQEYYCSFDSAVLGAVYGEWMEMAQQEGRIRPATLEKSQPVHTAWDLGFDDSTAIWFFQIVGTELRLVDYYENSLQNIEHYADIIKGKNYRYGDHWLPHDAAHKQLAAGGRSIVQQLYEKGVKARVVPALPQEQQIQVARKILPKCVFDEINCADGILSLKDYRFSYDEEKKVFSKNPVHNYCSHAADAFEIIGQTALSVVKPKGEEKPRFLHEIQAKEVFFPEKTGFRQRERI